MKVEGALQAAHGFVRASQEFEDIAQVKVRLGLPGIELNGLLKMAQGPVELPRRLEGATEAVVVDGDMGMDRQRTLDQLNGGLGLLPLQRQRPEHMECVRMLWLNPKDFSIKGF